MSTVLDIPDSSNSNSPDIPAPKLIKKFKKKYPIIFSIVVIIAFFIGVGISGGITKLTDFLLSK